MFGSQYMKPSFLIIGGVKCGTSSLYRYLNAHPQVLPCKTKEPGFLCRRHPLKFIAGIPKYLSLFPKKNYIGDINADWLDLDQKGVLIPNKIIKVKEKHKNYITGEANARTYFAARPYRVKYLLPNAKLIMLVRNPTERFYSHYNMYLRWHEQGIQEMENPIFQDYVAEQFHKKDNNEYNILEHGCYSNYLLPWIKAYGFNNIKIIHSNDFSKTELASERLNELCDYLGIDSFDFTEALNTKYNKANYPNIDGDAKKILDEYYESSNILFEKKYGIRL